jgi:hypothetical protein
MTMRRRYEGSANRPGGWQEDAALQGWGGLSADERERIETARRQQARVRYGGRTRRLAQLAYEDLGPMAGLLREAMYLRAPDHDYRRAPAGRRRVGVGSGASRGGGGGGGATQPGEGEGEGGGEGGGGAALPSLAGHEPARTLPCGAAFVKVWVLRNMGGVAWPRGTVMAPTGGDEPGFVLNAAAYGLDRELPRLPFVKPGAELEVRPELIYPRSHHRN